METSQSSVYASSLPSQQCPTASEEDSWLGGFGQMTVDGYPQTADLHQPAASALFPTFPVLLDQTPELDISKLWIDDASCLIGADGKTAGNSLHHWTKFVPYSHHRSVKLGLHADIRPAI